MVLICISLMINDIEHISIYLLTIFLFALKKCLFRSFPYFLVFPGSSTGKESTCYVGDSCSIPGLGRSAGEGIGYPLQDSWTSLVVHLVKNQLAMWETWVQSLGWEDPLHKRMSTHSSILAWRIQWTEEPGSYSPQGRKELDTTE